MKTTSSNAIAKLKQFYSFNLLWLCSVSVIFFYILFNVNIIDLQGLFDFVNACKFELIKSYIQQMKRFDVLRFI